VINKQLTAGATASISLNNFLPAGTGQVWQLTSANTIMRLSDISFSGTTFTSTVPVQSITLFVLPAVIVAGPASNPTPANGATSVGTTTSLSWTAGTNASAHQVYFGVSSNAVANATTNSPEFKGTFATTSYPSAPLASSGRFYWRVDELSGLNVTAGPVWTFATTVNPGVTFPLAGGLGSNDTFVVAFPSQLGQTYRVEWTDSLNPTAWQPLALNLPGTGYPISIVDPNPASQTQRFYRALILPP
jgi:hypothetical protein